MKRWYIALSLASAFVAVPPVRAEDKPTIGQKVDNTVDRTKEGAKDAKANWDFGRVYTMLGQVSNAALTKGGLDDMMERFVDADRNRLGPWVKDNAHKADLDKLDGRIAQFNKDWKAKYGHDFKIMKDDVVFGNPNFTVALGEIGKDAELAGKKLPPAEDIRPGDLNKPKDAAGNTAADRNLEKGRNVAYVTVAKSHDMPELKVPLIHELPDNWKIDVPDNIDGQKLFDNVLKHLTMANEQKDKWPADENEAYRMVSHHILMAIIGVEHGDAGGAAKLGGGDTAKPADQK